MKTQNYSVGAGNAEHKKQTVPHIVNAHEKPLKKGGECSPRRMPVTCRAERQ